LAYELLKNSFFRLRKGYHKTCVLNNFRILNWNTHRLSFCRW